MNGIQKITERIILEAQNEAQQSLNAGEEKLKLIKAEYEQKAQAEYEALMAKGKTEEEQKLAHRSRLVRLDAKKELLGVKMDALSRCYDRAKEMLIGLPREEYIAFLSALVADAASGSEQLIMNAKDAGSIGSELVAAANKALAAAGKPSALTLADELRDISGGFILKQGNIEVNCTPEALLEMNRNSLDAGAAKILFA